MASRGSRAASGPERHARRGRLRWVDTLTLTAVVVVVVLVSLPRLRGFALQENEMDAFRLIERLGRALDEAPTARSLEDLAAGSALIDPLEDGEWRRSGALLRRHGYLFDLVPASASQGPLLRAWPEAYGETGFAAFLRRRDGAVLGHLNAVPRWCGPEAPPELLAPGWRSVARLD